MASLDNYLHHKYQKKTLKKPLPNPYNKEESPNAYRAYIELMGTQYNQITEDLTGKDHYEPADNEKLSLHIGTTMEPVIQHETINSEISSLTTNLSQKALLELLRTQWKYINNATFGHILEMIGYPQPFPDITNITNITYVDNILEIIEGEKPNEVDEHNVPGHRVHKSRHKESDPTEPTVEKPRRSYGDIPGSKPNATHWASSRGSSNKVDSRPQPEDRPVHPF